MIKIFSNDRMADDRNQAKILFMGDYINSSESWWLFYTSTAKNFPDIEVSSITVNGLPAGNITMTSITSNAQDYNASLVFQRPATDINAPSESLVMNLSHSVPTKPVDGQYITALKDNGTVYDDIAVQGLQVFGNQVIGSPAIAYITGNTVTGDVDLEINNGSLTVSSLKVSSIFANTVVSTTTGSANSYTASLFMSTPVLYTNDLIATNYIQAGFLSTNGISTNTVWANNISTNYISTNDGYASSLSIKTANISTANISSLVAGNFGANRIDVTLLSSITGDITFNLVSTLSLFGNTSINPDINLGLGNVIQGLIGGAASQGLGVVLGGAALATGAVALVTGRTSGGANPGVFQTVNGTTQLQFSTLGAPTTSIFFATNSANPGTTPALETSTTITVPAGAYCVRSVSDPLYINNSVSSIQSFGQWVPVIQNNPTLPSFTLSTLTASTINAKSAEFSTLGVSTILGQTRMSTILTTGNILSQNPSATFVWGSPGYQTILSQTSTVMGNARAGTLTVLGDTFAQQVFGASGNFNTVTASNLINTSFLTGSNWVSTPALTVSSINGLAYPAPLSSNLTLSSINMTGSLTGLSPTGFISWPTNSGAPWSSTIIGAGGIITNTLSTQTANISSLNLVGNINTTNALATANFVNINTSTLNTSTITASTINTSSIISKGGSISTMIISSLNGQPYPPPNFGISLPSTLYLSTVNVNGTFTVTNSASGSPYCTIPRLFTTLQYMMIQVAPGTQQVLTIGGEPGQVVPYAINSPNILCSANLDNLFQGRVLANRGLTTTVLACDSASIGNLTATTINTPQFAVSSFTTNSISTGQILAYGDNRMSTLSVSSIGGFRATGSIIAGDGIVYALGSGTARSFITTNSIGGVTVGVASFPYLTATSNINSLGSALFVGGAQFNNAITATSATFSGTLTTSNVFTAAIIENPQTFNCRQRGYISSLTADIGSISTNSVQNLFVSFINGQSYPPQSGITGATPSTMYASTVFVNGGLSNTGIAPITSPIGNFSTLSSVNVANVLYTSSIVSGAGITNLGGQPIITSNLSAVNINNVAFINGQIYPPPSGSTSIPSTLYASTVLVNGGLSVSGPSANISSLNASTLNVNGGLSVSGPSANISSLNASTLNVNGGQTITGAPITFYDTALGRVGGYITTTTGLMQMSVNPSAGSGFAITSGSNLLSTLMFVQADGRSRFTSSMTVRNNIPVGTPSQAYIQTYITGSEAPAGSVITANVSTSVVNTSSIKVGNVKFQNDSGPNGLNLITSAYNRFADDNTLFYNEYYTNNTSSFFTFGTLNAPNSAYITAGNIQTYAPVVTPPSGQVITSTISTVNINTANINSIPYSLTLTPVGAITIWAGGAETTTTQDFAVPAGWLACDGSIIYQVAYPALYSVIGTKYGGAPPIPNTAYLPDLTFAVPMGTPKKPFATTPGTTDKYITMTAQTWATGYVPSNISTIQAWRISNVQGGTLNYGTRLNNVSATGGVTFPQMYISSILQFDGNPAGSGYVVVRSVDNVTPIPRIPVTSTINVTYAYGVIDTSVVGADSPYNLATYNIEGHPFTTRLQSRDEVAVHTHIQAQDPATPGTGNGLAGSQINYSTLPTNYVDGLLPNGDYITTSPLPISPVIAGTNNISTISTVAVSASNPPAENPINRAYQTAPNFLNMLYIIKC